MKKKFNVLFIITHDIGKRYGCYGNRYIKTPAIDRLAKDSVKFNNHFCHFPLCGPSRANIFTGLRPLKTKRFTNDPFFPVFREEHNIPTLPEVFKNSGYCTFGAGLVFHDVNDPPSWSEGFWRPELPKRVPGDMIIHNEESPNPWVNPDSFALIRERIDNLKRLGYTEKQIFTREGIRKVKGPPVEAGDVDDNVYFDGQTTERAINFLREWSVSNGLLSNDSIGNGGRKPFFLAVGYTAGHLPWNSPRKYWGLYNREELELPWNGEAPSGTEPWAMGDSEPAQYYTQHGYEKPWMASREQSLELMHGYYAAISYIDAMIGRLINALKELGIYNNTLIVFTSDHGFHTGEHGYWGKHNLWDTSLRVPLIVKLPREDTRGGYTGGEINQLTEHVDIYPTLCDICGVSVFNSGNLHPDGKSMLPLLRGLNPELSGVESFGEGIVWNKDAVFALRRHQWHDRIKAYDIAHTVRTSRYRYTMYLDERGKIITEELFDYQEDPGELENRASRGEYKGIKRELKERLVSITENKNAESY